MRQSPAPLVLLLWFLFAAPANAQSVPEINAFTLFDAALADGRLAAAEEILRRAPLEADDPERLLRQAEMALVSGRLSEAMGGFTALIDTPSMGARAWQGLGIVRLKRGDLPGAADALEKALANDPALVRAQVARGVVADRQRDWKRAETAYGAALAATPGHAPALVNRGWSRLLRGQTVEAEQDFKAALVADPKLQVAANNLRLAQAMQGNYEQAFAGSSPENLAKDMNMVGFAALSRGDDEVAEAYFRRAMEINPQYDKVAAANLAWLDARRKPAPR
jgi:Tfp pilus assembly protein PilF